VTAKTGSINALGYLILAALLVLSCGLGAYAAYGAMFAALIGFVVAFDLKKITYLLQQAWMQMWILAFVLISIAFVATAQTPQDVLYAFDFTQLLLALPAGLIFMSMSSHRGIELLALLSFLGTIAALLIALYGVYVLHAPRPSGIEISTIHFAYFSVILGFLSLTGLFIKNARMPLIYLLGPPMGFFAALMTGTRGAVLVLGAVLLVFIVCFIKAINMRWYYKALLIVGSIGAAALTIYGAYMIGLSRAFISLLGVAKTMQGGPIVDASTAYRMEHFSGGLKAFWDAPWIGHGWNNQLASALPYMNEFAQAGFQSENWAYLHNEALSLAVSAGALGIAAYTLIYAAPIIALVGISHDPQFIGRVYAILIITFGLFTGGMSDVLFKYELPKSFLFLLIPAFLFCCRDDGGEPS
jgi:O-antigen ligase